MAACRPSAPCVCGHLARRPVRHGHSSEVRHSCLSFEEVGVLMSCSEDAAKMLYPRGLKALRDSVHQEAE